MRKQVFAIIAVLFIANIMSFAVLFEVRNPKPLEADFFDIGQGDFVFLETPEGNQIIIDSGPDYNKAAEKLAEVMPFWDRTIDLVVITHPEEDHFSGLFGILKRYDVENIVWSGVEKDSEKFIELKKLIDKEVAKNKTKLVVLGAGDRIYAGSAEMDILFPFLNDPDENNKTTNDSSIVARLNFEQNNFLFTADISDKEEEKIISKGEDLKSDVLKVAHHGSKYSTSVEFLKKVMPKLAVIQVGNDNSYGHPAPETLTRLIDSGIKIVRNDRDGDIKIFSDGQNLKIITNPMDKADVFNNSVSFSQ
ncbi:MAG: MBL fold metallo-hydrolase [Candidatus Paceibacterota bacterium]